MTSICLIQSEVTELNSRKATKRNSELFPSCLTQEVSSVTRSQRASVLSSQTLLTILNVEPLYLRIVAAPENQGRLAEHCILKLLGYIRLSRMIQWYSVQKHRLFRYSTSKPDLLAISVSKPSILF